MTTTQSRTIAEYPVERLAASCPLILSILLDEDKIYPLDLRPGLSDYELQDAEKIVRVIKGNGPFLGIAGVMLVGGLKRSGKGLFANAFGWKLKRYFGKSVLRDNHAPALFGDYTFFNSDTLNTDVAEMASIASEDTKKLSSAQLKQYVKSWSTDKGQVLMQDAIIMDDEFWKDMSNRRPMDPMNIMYGGVLKTVYHLDAFVLGTIQRVHDLDRFTCLPDVNLHAKCVWCGDNLPNTTSVTIYHVEWNASRQELVPVDLKATTRWLVDGGEPREQLGGKRWFDIFYSKNAPDISSFMRKSDLRSIRRRQQEATEVRENDDEEDGDGYAR
ncbi:MAG: hypothetical protein JRN35_06080 [Nitrososphaerota archaeon]|nr:hypothetical protein [Nitrososphaerota archaeon]